MSVQLVATEQVAHPHELQYARNALQVSSSWRWRPASSGGPVVRCIWRPNLSVDPRLDPLRSRPEFRELLRQGGWEGGIPYRG